MNDNLLNLERLEAGIKQYDQILQSEPNNYQAWHIRGHILAQLNRYEDSIASYDKALAINVDDVASWYERGYVLSRINQHETAIASYDKAIELGHDDPETWYMRGKSYSAINDLDAALDSYEKASILQPDSGAIWYAHGYTLFSLDRYGAARISFSRATRYSPDSAYAWYFYGSTLEKTGDLRKALESLDNALAIEENIYFLTDRGRILRQLGQYDAALASYDRALDLNPDFDNALLNRGAILCDYLGHPQEALACFQRAVEVAPNYSLAWYNQGNALRKLERYEEAIASYEKAIELEPNYSSALYERDWLMFLTQYKQCQALNYDLALKLVNWTIEAFLDPSVHEEEQIENFLMGRGVQEIHAEELIAFIPIAFGRVYLAKTNAVLPPQFIWTYIETEQQYPVILSKQLIFQVANDVAVQWRQDGEDAEFMHLATWSAEVKVVQQLLAQDCPLAECVISPTVGDSAFKRS